MENRLSEIFNSLSFADRWTLRAGGISCATTEFMKEDTRRSPWKFPFYAVFLLAQVSPLPFPFAGSVFTALLIGTTSLRIGNWSREVNKRMREAFNGASLMAKYGAYVWPTPEKGHYELLKKDFAKYTARQAWQDTKDTTRFAVNRFLHLMGFAPRHP